MNLQDLLEIAAMGGRSTMDAIQQDIDRVRGGGLPTGAMEAGSQLLGGGSFNPIKVPKQAVDVGNMIYHALPEVTPFGSWLNHPAVQQKGGDLISAILELARPRFGKLPE